MKWKTFQKHAGQKHTSSGFPTLSEMPEGLAYELSGGTIKLKDLPPEKREDPKTCMMALAGDARQFFQLSPEMQQDLSMMAYALHSDPAIISGFSEEHWKLLIAHPQVMQDVITDIGRQSSRKGEFLVKEYTKAQLRLNPDYAQTLTAPLAQVSAAMHHETLHPAGLASDRSVPGR